MTIHFLLSSAARGLGVVEVMRLSDDEVRALLERARWPESDGRPVCGRCNMPARGPCSRGRYSCKWCRGQFTLTSGTALHGRKLPPRLIVLAVTLWASAVKGVSALQMSRMLNINYRTAFQLCHRLRHVLVVEAEGRRVGGSDVDVEIDGCHLGGYVKPANFKKNRRDRRLARNQNGKRRVVVVARERRDGGRSVITVVREEGDAVPWLRERIRKGSVVYADEGPGWADLEASHETLRINHREAYSNGVACTNGAEGSFARLRKVEAQHHHVAGPYLDRYATESMAREDHRRLSAQGFTLLLLHLALTAPPDPVFRGYDHRSRPPKGGDPR